MREILFRGKRIDNGEWVEGYLLRTKFYLDDSEHSLIFTDVVEFPRSEFGGANEVIPETVGQYTGINDKNGKRIFEGDIFSHNNKYLYEVTWCDERKGFRAIATELSDDDFLGDFYECNMEVIGNIHDNPELLEVEV